MWHVPLSLVPGTACQGQHWLALLSTANGRIGISHGVTKGCPDVLYVIVLCFIGCVCGAHSRARLQCTPRRKKRATRTPQTIIPRQYAQVELAQTEYQLPRLTRMWTHLDRVAGGGQVKGAGEKQIEIDKRLLRDKAAALRRWVRLRDDLRCVVQYADPVLY